MSVVTVANVSLSFSGKRIFHQIGFQIEPGDRVGLVGPNGSGKTTLLRLLSGELSPDAGEIRLAKGCSFGYLPQDVQEVFSGPLLCSVIDSIPGRVGLRERLSQVEQLLKAEQDKEVQTKLAQEISGIHQELHHLETEFPSHAAEKILIGLGFQASEFSSPVRRLSGGWKMRAALASLLYRKPDLLLLDEPTNHLDIPSVRWLEQFLQEFKGAIILVSHDRDFLNRKVNRTISLELEGVRFYSGNYDFYLKAREEEQRTLEAKARNDELKVKEAQKFIERFKAKASKARQAQSKIKLIKKMELVETYRRPKTMQFSFPEVPSSGRRVLSIRGLSKGFDGKQLYEDVELTLFRSDRIAVIGPNGCGKTTLLKMVAGEMDPDRGEISPGHGVLLSYFAQHHSEMLDPGKTVLQEVQQVVPHQSIGFVRSLCGAFLFSGDEVFKSVGVLSGGERARVSLAKLLARPGNFMVMDEPTNHLDINSSEKLIDALTRYQGSLLFVSHNQSFINRLANRIWDIRGKKITDYPGRLYEYLDHLERVSSAFEGPAEEAAPKFHHEIKAAENEQKTDVVSRSGLDKKSERRERAERRRLIYETLNPILNELERLEEKITLLEGQQRRLEKALADPDVLTDKDRIVSLTRDYNRVKEELDTLLLEWERTHVNLESMKANLEI